MTLLGYVFSGNFFFASVLTFVITIISMTIGILSGLALALLKESKYKAGRASVDLYVWIFRGTPVLLQLIFVFNVLPFWGLNFSPFTCAIIALSFNESAYMSEIIRAGLIGVDRGQRTAARVLGFKNKHITRYIILPQAFRLVLPPIGNQFIGMLKTSALVSVVSVQDLMLTAMRKASANFDYINTLVAAAIWYLFLTSIFTLVFRYIEKRFDIRRHGKSRLKLASNES